MENNENIHDSGIPKRRALGRGLEELFNSEVLDYTTVEEKIVNDTPKEEITMVKLDELRSNPYQPRKNFDEEALKELSHSIKEHGVFQPIIVKQSIKGYEIIAGERRVKASIMAGLKEIPAIIRDFNDTQMMEIALLENLQREDLNAIEEATAYKKLQETLSLTQEELARRLGKSRSHITNMIGLLNLPENIQKEIVDNKISMGHARVLSKISDEDKVNELANKIIEDDLSVRDTEKLASSSDISKTNKINRTSTYSAKHTIYEGVLREKIGTKVKISSHKIEIPFDSDNDLDRILEILGIDIEGE